MFVGRCAEHILKKHDYKNLLSVFIYASSMEERAERAMTVRPYFPERGVFLYRTERPGEKRLLLFSHGK